VRSGFTVQLVILNAHPSSNANDAFCVTTTLKAIESWVGKTINIQSLASGDFANKVYLDSNNVPKDLTCTSCVQAAYALIRPKLDDSNRGTWDNFLNSQCGSSFTSMSCFILFVRPHAQLWISSWFDPLEHKTERQLLHPRLVQKRRHVFVWAWGIWHRTPGRGRHGRVRFLSHSLLETLVELWRRDCSVFDYPLSFF
jgi:hypothetical protein